MLVLLALITLAATIAQAVSFRRLYLYVEAKLNSSLPTYMPYLSVIVPCKGLDSDFAENIRKLLKQDYQGADGKPAFEVLFAVAKEDDPAYSVLKEICAETRNVRTQLFVAGLNPKRGQKVNNQLCALEHIPDKTEALVFVDSDVIARADFLRYLVSELHDEKVGATTGYRFYIPFRGDWPSLLRSLWNRMTAWELASPTFSFAWGGAMATTRETFERAKVKEHWDLSADDDLALTTAVKDLGLEVRFVPQCLVASDGDATLSEIIEWTNRQLILTKVYYRKLWLKAIARAVILTVWLLAVIAALLIALTSGSGNDWLAAAVGLLLMPVEVWFLLKAQGLWLRVLTLNQSAERRSAAGDVAELAPTKTGQKQIEDAYKLSLWRFSLVIPLAHIVLPWMTLYSLLTNRIKWRGIVYELKSPSETVII